MTTESMSINSDVTNELIVFSTSAPADWPCDPDCDRTVTPLTHRPGRRSIRQQLAPRAYARLMESEADIT